MKTIFECETELGIVEQDWPRNSASGTSPAGADEPDVWRIYAHTKAALTRAQGMLKIEQRCFVRLGQEVSEFPSVKPDLLLEPALDTEEQSVSLVERVHQQFIDRARQRIAEGCAA